MLPSKDMDTEFQMTSDCQFGKKICWLWCHGLPGLIMPFERFVFAGSHHSCSRERHWPRSVDESHSPVRQSVSSWRVQHLWNLPEAIFSGVFACQIWWVPSLISLLRMARFFCFKECSVNSSFTAEYTWQSVRLVQGGWKLFLRLLPLFPLNQSQAASEFVLEILPMSRCTQTLHVLTHALLNAHQ